MSVALLLRIYTKPPRIYSSMLDIMGKHYFLRILSLSSVVPNASYPRHFRRQILFYMKECCKGMQNTREYYIRDKWPVSPTQNSHNAGTDLFCYWTSTMEDEQRINIPSDNKMFDWKDWQQFQVGFCHFRFCLCVFIRQTALHLHSTYSWKRHHFWWPLRLYGSWTTLPIYEITNTYHAW